MQYAEIQIAVCGLFLLQLASAGNSDLQEEEASESGTENSDTQNETDSGTSAGDNGSEPGGNILVAYFSRVGNIVWENGVDTVTSAGLNVESGEYVGNAEYLARMVQEATGGDLTSARLRPCWG